MSSFPDKLDSKFDYFVVGDLVSVFYMSELSSRVRITGICTSKLSRSASFEVFVKGEILYRFSICNPNLVRIYNLRNRRTQL